MKKIFKDLINKISNIFSKKILIVIFDICLILAIIQVSTGYEEELIKQDQEMMYEINPVNIDYYYETIDTSNIEGDMAITNMFNCYRQNNDLDSIYQSIEENIKELEKFTKLIIIILLFYIKIFLVGSQFLIMLMLQYLQQVLSKHQP